MSTATNPVETVVETLKGMNALQLAELKTQIEDVFGVTAAAPMAAKALGRATKSAPIVPPWISLCMPSAKISGKTIRPAMKATPKSAKEITTVSRVRWLSRGR